MLTERRVLRNIRLSDTQKEVLAMAQAAPNPSVAAGSILDAGRSHVAAKNLLVRLGLLTFHENQAEITDKGMEVMKQANLVDETGQLTDDGNKFAYPDDEEGQTQQPQQPQSPQGPQEPTGGVDQGPLAGVGEPYGESFSLIRSIHEEVQFRKDLERFTENMQQHYSDDPKEQTAFEDGYEAGLTDAGRHRNPYHKRNRLHKAWLDGYEAGWEY